MRNVPRVPSKKACDDYFLGYQLLFSVVVVATVVMLIVTAAAYLVALTFVDAATLVEESQQTQRQ